MSTVQVSRSASLVQVAATRPQVAVGVPSVLTHNDLLGRTAADAHPITAITGLSSLAAGDLFIAASPTAAGNVTLGTAGRVLVAGASAPEWSDGGLSYVSGRLRLGSGTHSADDSLAILRRESTAVPNSHAVRDESVWTVASGGGGYCAFDSAPSYAGASAFNHLHSFQSRQSYNGTASLTDLVGYWSQEAHIGSGTVTNRRGLWVKDPTGSGTITNNIGIHVDTLTRGVANTAIYTAGPTKCQFDGNIILGQSHTTAGTPVIAMTSTVAGDHGMNVRNLSTGTSSYAYFSLRNNATASALFTSYGSGYTGTGYGLTLGNFTALQAFGASNLGFILGTSSAIPLIIGTNNAEVARFPSGGGLVIGSTALLASERLRVAGGTMGTPGATDVLLAAGKVYAGDTSATSIQTAGGVTAAGDFISSAAKTGSQQVNVRNTAAGTGDYARLYVQSDGTAGCAFQVMSSTFSGSLFGVTRANAIEMLASGAAATSFIIGAASANIPIVIGINTSEVARFTSGTLSTGKLDLKYTTDGALTVAGKITAKVAVPGSFADLAAVRTYLASILT